MDKIKQGQLKRIEYWDGTDDDKVQDKLSMMGPKPAKRARVGDHVAKVTRKILEERDESRARDGPTRLPSIVTAIEEHRRREAVVLERQDEEHTHAGPGDHVGTAEDNGTMLVVPQNLLDVKVRKEKVVEVERSNGEKRDDLVAGTTKENMEENLEVGKAENTDLEDVVATLDGMERAACGTDRELDDGPKILDNTSEKEKLVK